ncbi:uncharacterized protein LOC118733179 [Rhagoletis pomonella]|uniref:uncharacterized protein LOC118733179 n=1 Tax=Rhagoletis pomonella TaxID=28610 RepID=UPI00177C3F81|nr:uncharacterized protein LOC118733179 [Rhagoletis pomonella]
MLKELNVEDKTYFFECAVQGDVIEYLLYDSNENWTAVKTQEEVAQTLQLLNKRIKYDVATAYDTLQNTQPESANWMVKDHGVDASSASERILTLKYRVKGCPFKFEWLLKREDKSLTIPLPVNEVTSLVDRLPVQIEELLEVLRRKEDEIIQYRTEYGSLRRSTVATNPFDVNKFRERYAATDMKVKILQKLIARWRVEHGQTDSTQAAEISQSNTSSPTNIVKKEETERRLPSNFNKILESPRNRKRRAKQEIQAQMKRTLHARRQKLEYESQSQSMDETKEVIEESEKPTSSGKAIKNTKCNENETATASGKKGINTPIKSSNSNVANADKSQIIKAASEPVKEVASKTKKLSPRVEGRPDTRQRRRECEIHDNSPSDLMIIENPLQNVVYTVDESVEPVKINGVNGVIGNATNQNVKIKLYSSNIRERFKSQSMDKVQQPKNDVSAYVDSVLSQLDAFDKELKAQFSSACIE